MTALIAEQFPINLPGHLSVSAIRDFLDCPLKWWGSRVAKWKRPPASAPLAGIAFHAAVEIHHRQNEADPDPELELVQRWKTVKPVIASEQALGKAVLVSMDRSLQALALYRARFPRQPYDSTEEFFKVRLPGVNVPLIGYMDVVTAENTIRDIKTTASSSWTQEKADGDLQATAYCYAFHQITGVIPPFEFVILYTGSQKPVTLTVLQTTRTETHFRAFELLVKDVYDRMQLGNEVIRATCKPARYCNFPENCELFGIEQRRLTGEPEPEVKPRREKVEKQEPRLVLKGAPALFAGRSALEALGGED